MIVRTSFRDGQIIVVFADGGEARLSPHVLVSTDQTELDWDNLRVEEFHLVVPGPAGDVEIPWDVIRVHSDPVYDAYWAELGAEPANPNAEQRAKLTG